MVSCMKVGKRKWIIFSFIVVGVAVVLLQTNQISSLEGFSQIGTDMTGQPKPSHTPYQFEKPPIQVPTAQELSSRYCNVHQTGMGGHEQYSNHRRPDEYATMENGTAKPFEMSSEFFHDCSPTHTVSRHRTTKLPWLHKDGYIRVGAYLTPLDN